MKNTFQLITVIVLGLVLFSCNKKKKRDFDVVYEVEFVSYWSQGTHPTNFPSNAHMSPIIGISHENGYDHFLNGATATSGIKAMAETGNTGPLQTEFEGLISSGVALDFVKGEAFDSPGTSEKAYLGVDDEHSYVTLMSMVAPSPDWYVAAKSSLKNSSGSWLDNLCIRVSTYDAGTDSGAVFTSANMPVNPFENIQYIMDGPLTEGTDTVMNMGYFNLKRIQ